MKKLLYILFAICSLSLAGCKDELQDTLFDHAFYEPYEGHDVRILGLQIYQQGNDYGVDCQLMTYASEWPQGVFQLRYGLDHDFNDDTLLYAPNPIAPDASAIINLKYGIERGDVFKPYNTVNVKPCYITDSGDICEGKEYVFEF